MNLLLVCCSHESAPLAVREKLAFPNSKSLRAAYESWQQRHPEFETVVLSTCNRVEIYAASERRISDLNPQKVIDFLAEFHDVAADDFRDCLTVMTSTDVVRHLFEVTSSLDSMVLGEPQIVNQVKEAYRESQEAEACGPITNLLFQRAVSVSARVRSETKLAEGRVSIASVAVGEFGKRIFNRFDDKRVLIIGAGAMAEETLRYLQSEGATNIAIVNRDPHRAQRLANEFGGAVATFEDLDTEMSRADVIVSTTGAATPIVDRDRMQKVRQSSRGQTLFVLDLGAPRDFAHDAGDVDDNVFLYDIDDLREACDANRQARSKEIEAATDIVADATDRLMQDLHHRTTGPVISRLKREWHDISQQELELLFRRLPHLNETDREAIERVIGRIVNKLLHPPLETLKGEAKEGPPEGLLDAMRHLFQLKD